MLMALAGEVSVMRDRIDTIERLAARKRVFSARDIETYRPDEAVQAARDKRRAEFLDVVLRIVQDELDDVRRAEHEREYEDIVSGVAVR
jgi:acetyl-CoA carboxylase alpha subunit